MHLRIAILIVLAGLVAAGCGNAAKPPVPVNNPPRTATPAPPASHGHNEPGPDVPRITLADAKKDFDAKAAVFVDTHAPEQFAQRHIPGAINVPANDLEPYVNKIPKGKKIIAYCS